MKKTAFLSEPRKHKALKFVLENFISILPEEWDIQINHGTKNIDYIKKIVDESEEDLEPELTIEQLRLARLKALDKNYIEEKPKPVRKKRATKKKVI